MFLTPQQTTSTNRHVLNGPEHRNPSFKHAFPGRLDISGGILRYSTTTPKPTDVSRAGADA